MTKSRISLLLGVPPSCDRCCEEDAKVKVDLPRYGERQLCEKCCLTLIESSLRRATTKIMPRIFVRINDGDTVEVKTVRVFVEGIVADGDKLENTQIQYNFTDEGVITDLVDSDDVVCGTNSIMYEELATNLYFYN